MLLTALVLASALNAGRYRVFTPAICSDSAFSFSADAADGSADAAVSPPAQPAQAPADQPQQPDVDRVDQDGNPIGSGEPDDHQAKEPPTPPHTGVHALLKGTLEDFQHLPSWPNAVIAMTGGAATITLRGFDQTVNAKLRGHQDTARPVFMLGKWIGQTPVQVGAAIGVYAWGRVEDEPKVSHFGMDLLRAQIVTGALTTGLKVATQRERPDHSNNHSFPSGHASVTFATATVIERHLGWKMSVVGYTIAGYVASSRLHDNRHWLTDVVFGAAVGTIGGRTVTQHGRSNWTFAPVSVPGGVAFLASRNH